MNRQNVRDLIVLQKKGIADLKRCLYLLLVMLAVYALAGCNNTMADNEIKMQSLEIEKADVAEETEMPEEYSPAPVYVSPYATEMFLEPLDKYSWEREYPCEYVVLHFTSNVVADRENPLDMTEIRRIFEDNEISINYILDRDGNVFCYVPESRAAWHAGVGTFADDEKYTNKMNKFSIGIEIAAIGSEKDMAQYLTKDEYASLDKSLVGFTDGQYESLKRLVRDVCERNGIPFDREHIIGHDEYNPSKNDPGELFEWNRIFEE